MSSFQDEEEREREREVAVTFPYNWECLQADRKQSESPHDGDLTLTSAAEVRADCNHNRQTGAAIPGQ